MRQSFLKSIVHFYPVKLLQVLVFWSYLKFPFRLAADTILA